MLRRRLPQILFVLVLVAAAAGGYSLYQQRLAAERAAAAANIRQAVIERGTIISTVNATGYLAPQDQTNLFFAVGAGLPVVELNVALGDAVTAGQVLARLDDAALRLAVTDAEQALAAARLRLALLQTPPRPEDLAVAEANLRVANNQVYAASLGQTPEQVEIARLNLVLAQYALDQTYAAMDRLVEQGKFAEKNALQSQADQQVEAAQIANLRYQEAQQAPSYAQTAGAQASVEQAQAALDRLRQGPDQSDLDIAQLQISQAQAALEISQHNLANAVLTASHAGVVAAVNLHLGEPAGPLPAVVLADVSRFYLDVLVDEVDVAAVHPGQAVTVTLDASPNLLIAATVEKIAPVAQVSAGVVSYPVRLGLAPVAAQLRGGLTATAAIVVAEVRDVVLVPNWAIRRDRDTGAAYVSLLRDGALVEVLVTLGARDENYSQIVSGVEAGEIAAVSDQRDTFSILN
ncbi:MAG: efflux RND transporter periplasmic adaptor subunit [Anaerolineales bacterium]|nr:efflux RND transporter periplasmic adaptor subunit [Anaerolineales bacterium]